MDSVKRYRETIRKILDLKWKMIALSDRELQDKTTEFKARIKRGDSLESLLPEAFAVVREASYRVNHMRHYPVQLLGGIVLHEGKIAEMKTGEGKTLVATLPSYLNALTGKGVHVVTVNDYLADRDAQLMGGIHTFLGLSVGVVLNETPREERKAAYGCDITYVTNSELGFDYLRDTMVLSPSVKVLRGLPYAIID